MSRDAEVAYLLDGLAQNIRNDGRGCDEARAFEVEYEVVPSANSSCRVKRGSDTEVIVAIKAELGAPLVNNPSCGIVRFSCEFSSLLAEEASVEAIINDFVLSHFRTEQLCVYDSMLAWTLCIDCLVESSNGSLLDVIALALRLALKSLVLPKVLVHPPEEAGEKPRVAFDENILEAVDASTLPLSLSLGITADRLFIDPDGLEERVSARASGSGLINVFAHESGKICGVRKVGEAVVDPEVMPGLVNLAKSLARKIVVP
jgi:exosome complex component RRP42